VLREAAGFLGQARRPVIVAGGGVTASGAGAEVAALAERLSIPVATSLNGKEALLETHPLNVGVVGRYSRWCANGSSPRRTSCSSSGATPGTW